MTTRSVHKMTADLNLWGGTSPPAAAFWDLVGVQDAMDDGTYRYRGNENNNVVVVGGGRLHPSIRIATT